MRPITSSSLATPPLPYQGKDPQKIQETAEKFTSVFYTQFVSEMMKEQESMGGFGEDMFKSVLAESIAEQLTLSETGQEMVEIISQQLVQLQGGTKGDPTSQTLSSASSALTASSDNSKGDQTS